MTDFSFVPIDRDFVSRPTEEVVLIDVGEKSIAPDIVRDGVPVGRLDIDFERFDDFFGGRPAINQKIVSQSIAPGTPVQEGTAVDLVMAEPGTLPVGVVKGVLFEFVDTPVDTVFARFLENNPDLIRILARAGDSDVLSAADETRVREVFTGQQVILNDEPGSDLGAAVQTLRVANTFRT